MSAANGPLAPDFDQARAPDFDQARDLDLDQARDLDLDLARDFGFTLYSVSERDNLIGDLVRDIARTLTRTSDRGRTSDRDLALAGGSREAQRIASSAAGLLTAAARLLPTADRARYAEEYRAELWDLALAGAGRIRQLRYALRQLRSALPTGFALRSPRRRSAAP